MLLHYYSCADDYPNLHCSAQKEAIEDFLEDGYLVKAADGDYVKY